MGKEQFEIQETVDTSGAVPRQALSGSQSTTSQPLTAPSRTQGLTYLVAEHAKEAILQAEGPITGTVTLRPIGMHSETHQMLVRAVGQKHNKVARLRMAPDPVRDLEKEKAELLKSQSKKPRQRRDRGEDDLGAPRRRKSYGRRRTSDQYVSDEEGDWGSGGDSDDNITPKKRGGRTKDSGDYQTGDFVVSDEDDEDEEETPRKRKKAREVSDEEDEEEKDVLDEMEEKIEKERAAKKKKRKGPISDAVVDEKEESEEKEEVVEVESEERDDEDEEEERIRRAGTGTRRKRILEEEEE
jgi:RNA polymerase-associated protein LEO1